MSAVVDDTVVDMPVVVGLVPPIPEWVVYWRGEATGSWWAMVAGRLGPRLVEAGSEEQLAVLVDWHLRTAVR